MPLVYTLLKSAAKQQNEQRADNANKISDKSSDSRDSCDADVVRDAKHDANEKWQQDCTNDNVDDTEKAQDEQQNEAPNAPKRKRLCFATMCRDEAHCIRETLESVADHIDYWIVSDTSSVDNTIQVITDFFEERGIAGELWHDDWTQFDVNKSALFRHCFAQRDRFDYVLHLDADDLLVGTPQIEGTKDRYLVSARRGGGVFSCVVLWSSAIPWKWCSVRHTIVRALDANGNEIAVSEGDLRNKDFHMVSRDTGARSADPEKYRKDALLLQSQFFETLRDDPDKLMRRSCFYCAQSFYDALDWNTAIKWYTLFLNLRDCSQEERHEAHLRIGYCLQRVDPRSARIEHHFAQAIELAPDKAEGWFHLGRQRSRLRKCELAYGDLHRARLCNLEKCQRKYYLFTMPYCYGSGTYDELSVACFWTKRKSEGMFWIAHLRALKRSSERIEANWDFLESIDDVDDVSEPQFKAWMRFAFKVGNKEV